MQEYTRVIAKDKDTRELDSNVSRVFESIKDNPLLGTLKIIKGLTFISGIDQTVSHKLGKPVAGFIITNSNAAVNVFQSTVKNIAPTTGIILQSNANAIVDILFF